MSVRIDEIIHACQTAGSLALLFRLALPDESDSEIQRGADALPLAGRKRSTRTEQCNMQRARLVRCYREMRNGRGFDAAAFTYAFSRFRKMPDGSVITETRARDLVGSKCPRAVSALIPRAI